MINRKPRLIERPSWTFGDNTVRRRLLELRKPKGRKGYARWMRMRTAIHSPRAWYIFKAITVRRWPNPRIRLVRRIWNYWSRLAEHYQDA